MYQAAQMILLPTGDDDGGSIMLNTSQVRALWQAMLAVAPTPPTQAADSVLEDVARWKMAVLVVNEVMLPPEKRTHPAAVKAYMDAVQSGLDLTGAIDAARKQGGKP